MPPLAATGTCQRVDATRLPTTLIPYVGSAVYRASLPVMQHLLDFIHEHNLEQQLYLVVETPEGALSLTWRRQADADGQWEVQSACGEGAVELVHYGDLLDHLEQREVDLTGLERELRAIVLTNIAVADVVLRDARQVLGNEAVQRRLFELRASASQLSAAHVQLSEPRPMLTLIRGAASKSSPRTGQLTLVR